VLVNGRGDTQGFEALLSVDGTDEFKFEVRLWKCLWKVSFIFPVKNVKS